MAQLTEKQKQIVNQLSHEMDSWRVSNDVTSPTVGADIHEVLLKFGVAGPKIPKIRKKMMQVLKLVREIK